MIPLEPFAVCRADGMSEERYAAVSQTYGHRLDGLFTDAPIPHRKLTGGDDGRDMRLLLGVEPAGAPGLDIHLGSRD
jgi:NAD(P)H dehydrogenase (quinone)